MHKLLTLYYVILVGVVGFKLFETIFQASLLVYHAHTIASLSREETNLQKQNNALKQQLAREQSLLSIAEVTASMTFEPISKPIVLTTSTTMASANVLP